MNKEKLNVIFTFSIFIVFVWAAITALTFSRLAQFFPLYVSVAGSILSGFYLFSEIIKRFKQKEKGEKVRVPIIRPCIYIAWVIGYILLIYLIGLLLASTIFLIAFLVVESKFAIFKALYSTGIAVGVIIVLSTLLNISWPQSLIGI
ncbi:tripartite tricarboxylate transporter TctB family protein [Alteribacillus sp. YIM 98480]|uniref:tripartite tricarboxylate transporter TctB family protein n=1 Tax=Alteribacillus sp. YIM 98480 TaxID=2606599 RepID=UPI00131A7CDD|nr:tripartite tricarboxylate transporter TctB family protein [Alteribacillus sp. YIM 98480]